MRTFFFFSGAVGNKTHVWVHPYHESKTTCQGDQTTHHVGPSTRITLLVLVGAELFVWWCAWCAVFFNTCYCNYNCSLRTCVLTEMSLRWRIGEGGRGCLLALPGMVVPSCRRCTAQVLLLFRTNTGTTVGGDKSLFCGPLGNKLNSIIYFYSTIKSTPSCNMLFRFFRKPWANGAKVRGRGTRRGFCVGV